MTIDLMPWAPEVHSKIMETGAPVFEVLKAEGEMTALELYEELDQCKGAMEFLVFLRFLDILVKADLISVHNGIFDIAKHTLH